MFVAGNTLCNRISIAHVLHGFERFEMCIHADGPLTLLDASAARGGVIMAGSGKASAPALGGDADSDDAMLVSAAAREGVSSAMALRLALATVGMLCDSPVTAVTVPEEKSGSARSPDMTAAVVDPVIRRYQGLPTFISL
jgi:hypothetical protein